MLASRCFSDEKIQQDFLRRLLEGFESAERSATSAGRKVVLPCFSTISAASGIITEFISSIFFYLYNRTVRQLKEYHDSLIAVQNVLLAFKLIHGITDPDKQADATQQMITVLLAKQDRTSLSINGAPVQQRANDLLPSKP